MQLKKLQSANVSKSWYTGLYFECDLDDEDPFLVADESMALQGLIDEAMTGRDHCPLVNGEDDIPVCLHAC